ncbi:hypothetical protein A0128_04430 [Leptospira tipperaryensis]|uniref:Uncharacterized protein n=1 Tax=Leptospira tipperaryensis TaxID=2564040 RepID=A0A1D7UUD3_9LEPT|nr:hypothetical protein A0128_04430 [Leptospira tipperaryensis]
MEYLGRDLIDRINNIMKIECVFLKIPMTWKGTIDFSEVSSKKSCPQKLYFKADLKSVAIFFWKISPSEFLQYRRRRQKK